MGKLNVYLAQVNNSYGRNAFLPYSVGLLQSYAMSFENIRAAYDFKGFVYLREPIQQVVDRLVEPAIFGVSCYIWNWQYSMALAAAVKEAFPECLMVLGGPHVPMRSDGFFLEYPYADILVHNEGEESFKDILQQRISPVSAYTAIPGLSIKSKGLSTLRTSIKGRTDNLDSIPSPYLAGIFDDVLEADFDFHATQETNRGCPWGCHFCDWGSSVMSKVRKFSDERILAEIEWFSGRRIDLLYNADANFAMFKRDVLFAKAMANAKSRTGFPNKFRAAYAKNSSQTVYETAKILNDAGMNKGVTLSFQSMDKGVLEAVNRGNIRTDDFRKWMKTYSAEGIPTYSEIILGLPEETYSSFADGLATLMECGQHDSIQIYTCEVLPNSEMNDPSYKKRYGIKTKKIPVLFYHGTPSEDPHQEHYDLVTGTDAMPEEDWLKCQMFAWAVQCFHCLSLTQDAAIVANGLSVGYRRFYEGLLDFGAQRPGKPLGRALMRAKALFQDMLASKGCGVVDQRFGPIIWPPEEAAFLGLVVDKDEFYSDILDYVIGLGIDARLASDIVAYQKAVIKDPFQPDQFNLNLSCGLHEHLSSLRTGLGPQLGHGPARYEIRSTKAYGGDLEAYAREVVWYGRKGGKFRHSDIIEV